ncbi:MAG TPA: translocation/assembly module TamB domain-containing protein, partial [Longimicrobiaceae bacterium]
MLLEQGPRAQEMAGRRTRRRATVLLLVLLGLALGALLVWVGVRMYVREARLDEASLEVANRLKLPRDAFELEDVSEDGTVRMSLLRVALVDRRGDTILSAPSARLLFHSTALSGTGPIRFDRLEVSDPYLRLVEMPDGEWNLSQAFRVEADGSEVRFAAAGSEAAEDASRPFFFRDVRISDGRADIATQVVPGDPLPARLAARGGAPLVRMGGRTMVVRRVRGVQARLPLVRVGGTQGWRAEVSEMTATVANPDLRVAQLRGWIEQTGTDRYRFDLQTLRTPYSTLSGGGGFRLAESGILYDMSLRAAPLDFRDLRGLGFGIPAGGRATGSLAVLSLPGGRTSLRSADLAVSTPDSRASGRFAAVVGGGRPWAFSDTRITLDPLDLGTLAQLGFADIPYTGQVRGTVASVDRVEEGRGGTLGIDLVGSFLPRGASGEPSVVAAVGSVALGGEAGLRLDAVRVEAKPLRLAALTPYFPDRAEMLRGVLRGSAVVSGTTSRLRVSDGTVAYEVGAAPPTRITGLAATVALAPTLRYDVEGRAAPLALATLTELFPALPFRAATLSGPFAVSGTATEVRFSTDMRGAAGRLAASGTFLPGADPRFDVSGRVEAFRSGVILASGSPVEGPLTGTFSARGATRDFGFDVDLAQGAGSFALGGRIRRPGDQLQFDVAGRVDRFRLGSLLGRPTLFDSPVTGTVALNGGGRQPVRFDVDLRGDAGLVDLQGWFRTGAVPSYAVTGQVAGINMQQLPGLQGLPASSLNASIDLQGRGTTPETFEGRLSFAARSSTVAGVTLDAATARLVAEGGVVRVDTLDAAFRGTRLTASGTWGLTRPAPGLLRFTLSSPNLAAVAPLAARTGMTTPDVAGSIAGSGWVAGTFRAPVVGFAVEGSGLRYGTWRAGRLTASGQLARAGQAWTGRVSLLGSDLALAGREKLESLRLEVNATPQLANFGVFARRDAESDLSASGALEFEEGELRGALLQQLDLRIATTTWNLQQPSTLRWGGVRGVEVERLALRRGGSAAGVIEVDGRLPPEGNADLRLRFQAVELADLRRITSAAPDVQGTLNLAAVLEGPVGDPRMTLTGSIDSLRYAGAAAERVAIDARYLDRRLTGSAVVRIAGRDILNAQGTVPMQISLGGTVPGFELLRSGPLDLRLTADSVPAALVAASLTGVRDAAGTLAANVTVRGTLDDPAVSGWAALVGGAATVDALGQRITGVAAAVTLQGQEVRIDSLVARSRGSLRLAGTVLLDQPTTPRVALQVDLDGFRAIDRDDLAVVTTSGRLALSGRLPDATLSGRLVLDEGTIQIPSLGEQQAVAISDAEVGEIGADTIPSTLVETNAGALFGGLRISQLQVVLDDGVWLESEDARIQIRGDLLITRAGDLPRVYGDLEAVRGTYTMRFGPLRREFDIERGLVQFYGTPEFNPTLDILATNDVRTFDPGGSGAVLQVQVQVSGTLQSPRIRLTSNTRPPLPESELLSYLIFGRSSANLGGAAGGLAQQILAEELFGGLVAAQLEQELSRSGLVDYVRVRSRPGEAGTPFGGGAGRALGTLGLAAPTLEFGWELTDDVFATLEVGIPTTGDPFFGIGLDWQISEQTRLRAAREAVRPNVFTQPFYSGPAYQWSLDVRHRWEWGRPREDSASARPRPPAQGSAPAAPPPA